MSLIQVIQHGKGKAKEFYQEELNPDFQSKNVAPSNVNGSGILKHASNVYTLAILKSFEEELRDNIRLNCFKEASDENLSLYQSIEDSHEEVYFVKFSISNSNVSHTCNIFEALGLLCHHALWVLVMNSVKEMLESYILKRWTKIAKSMFVNDVSVGLVNEEKSTCLLCCDLVN